MYTSDKCLQRPVCYCIVIQWQMLPVGSHVSSKQCLLYTIQYTPWPLSDEWSPMDMFDLCIGSFPGTYVKHLQCEFSLTAFIIWLLWAALTLHPRTVFMVRFMLLILGHN